MPDRNTVRKQTAPENAEIMSDDLWWC